MQNRALLTALGLLALSSLPGRVDAQTTGRPAHASMYLQATSGATSIPFDWNEAGTEFVVRWGMDTAWDSEANVACGTNYIGKDNMSTGRISFQPSDLVDENGELSADQKSALDSRIKHIKQSGTTSVEVNCDHEVLNASNYKGKPEQWYKVIKATVKYAQDKGLTVESVAPFNEPDYTSWNEGSKADFLNICKLIKADPDFDGIRICGGNTLNCDQALTWYNYLKDYLDEGNTHQLAGSFDSYASFFQTVKNDGKVATADELHNVGEAIVGVEYGMENGIWWSFDGVARGEFCKANTQGGSRLAYAEDRDSWTAGAVYRLPEGKVEGFLGSSERQATTHTYDFISKGRDVYYDGYGPVRSFSVTMPGGNGYQNGQTNAERMVLITSGEDVQPYPIESGEYVIMNKKTRKVMQASGNPVAIGASITQGTYNQKKSWQQWKIDAVDTRIGGDFSYYTIRCANRDSLYLDLLNWSTTAYGELCAYNGGAGTNEQWVVEYADNGDFYIRSRYSGLYLQINNTSEGSIIIQNKFTGNNEQRWRILPVGSACETVAPKVPAGLTAEAQTASVLLRWKANTDKDLEGYIVLRAEVDNAEPQWQVIGRQVADSVFVDNSCSPGAKYLYKVKAIDHSCNMSKASDEVTVDLPVGKSLVACYDMEGSLRDTTENLMDAVAGGSVSYNSSVCKVGSQSLKFGGTGFLQLPAQVANYEQMTVATWVNWQNTSSTWTRIFDFGNGTDEYMFLTPSNGSQMRFVVKYNGEEQILSATKLKTGWHHVAVTLGEDEVCLYVDGNKVGSSQELSYRPSQFQPGRCYIGRSQFSADPLFKGYIDDFRIYSYALSEEEVQKLMNGELTGIHTPAISSSSEITSTEIYSLEGIKLNKMQPGVNILREIHKDGSSTMKKIYK